MWQISASHVPVLVYLTKQYDFKNILEIGSGELSTNLFLDRNIFKHLQALTSVEENSEWLQKTQQAHKDDTRFTITDKVPVNLYHYDFIFIDGPQDEDRRAKMIQYVTRNTLPSMVVIHDMENRKYIKAVNYNNFNEFIFDPVSEPATGVYSKDILPTQTFKKVNRFMRKHYNDIQESWNEWSTLFDDFNK
jgi:hypothetical protein